MQVYQRAVRRHKHRWFVDNELVGIEFDVNSPFHEEKTNQTVDPAVHHLEAFELLAQLRIEMHVHARILYAAVVGRYPFKALKALANYFLHMVVCVLTFRLCAKITKRFANPLPKFPIAPISYPFAPIARILPADQSENPSPWRNARGVKINLVAFAPYLFVSLANRLRLTLGKIK